MKDFNIKEYSSSVAGIGNGVYVWDEDLRLQKESFEDTIFFGFEATRSEFSDCTFDNCKFRFVDINHSRFEGCTFENCVFENSDLSYCTFTNCTFHSTARSIFFHSDMVAARFVTCHMHRVSFTRCQAEDLDVDNDSHTDMLQFAHCDLERASISPICTNEVNFFKCNLLNVSIYPTGVDNNPVKILNDQCIIERAHFPAGQEARHGTILTEEMIGYKKCRNNFIVTLRIPAGAVVFQPNLGKCRTNVAEVVEICDSDGVRMESASSKWDGLFTYKVGEVKRIDNFCLDPSIECAPGIHFFKTREEAEDYEQ